MVALQDKIDRIEKEVSQIESEVKSDFEIKIIQLEQKMDKQTREFDDKLQVTKSETMLLVENKKEQLESTVKQKIDNNKPVGDMVRSLLTIGDTVHYNASDRTPTLYSDPDTQSPVVANQ